MTGETAVHESEVETTADESAPAGDVAVPDTDATGEVPEWINLSEGEEIIWHSKPVIYPYILTSKPSLIPILIGLPIFALGGFALMGGSTPAAIVLTGFGGFLIFSGVSAIVRNMLRWYGTEFLVTDDEVYNKRGVFSRSVRNVEIGDIQKSSFSQSWFARLLSYGDVRIGTAATSGTEIRFRNVKNPNDIADMIDDLSE